MYSSMEMKTTHFTSAQVGHGEATVELIVRGPPIFNHEKNQYAVLGEDNSVTCSLGSYPGIQHIVRFRYKLLLT